MTAQHVRNPVRPCFQVGVAQDDAACTECNACRRPIALRLEVLMHAAGTFIGDRCRLQRIEFRARYRIDQRQAGKPGGLALDCRTQQGLVGTQPAPHGGGIEQIGVVLALEHQLALRMHCIDEQFERLAGARIGLVVHLQAGVARALLVEPRVDIEHHAHQRHPRGIARDSQLLEQRAEGVSLVFDRIDQGRLRPLDQLGEGRGRIDIEAQRQRIDAMSHQRVAARGRLPGRRDGDHDVRLPAQARQQSRKAGQQGGKHAYPATGAQLAQGRQEGSIEHVVFAGGSETAQRWSLPIGGQFEYRWRAFEARQPVGLVRDMRRVRRLFGLVQGVLGKAGRRIQGFGVQPAVFAVQHSQFLHEHPPGPSVTDDVVVGEQQQVILVAQTQQLSPQQGIGT